MFVCIILLVSFHSFILYFENSLLFYYFISVFVCFCRTSIVSLATIVFVSTACNSTVNTSYFSITSKNYPKTFFNRNLSHTLSKAFKMSKSIPSVSCRLRFILILLSEFLWVHMFSNHFVFSIPLTLISNRKSNSRWDISYFHSHTYLCRIKYLRECLSGASNRHSVWEIQHLTFLSALGVHGKAENRLVRQLQLKWLPSEEKKGVIEDCFWLCFWYRFMHNIVILSRYFQKQVLCSNYKKWDFERFQIYRVKCKFRSNWNIFSEWNNENCIFLIVK